MIGSHMVQITQESAESFRFQAELLAAVGQAIVVVDLERTVIYWNRAAEQMFGWSAAEALGQKSVDVLVRAETSEQTQAIYTSLFEGRAWTGDYQVTRRDGTPLSVLVTNTPVFDADGTLVAIMGTSVDLTERNLGEKARRQLAALVENSADAIFSTTVAGVITTWNKAAEQLFGYDAADITGQSISVLAPPNGGHEQIAVREHLADGGAPLRLETVRRRRDGALVDVTITASAIRDDDGEINGLSVMAHDITERVTTQRALATTTRRLEEAQRNASIGSFEFDVTSEGLVWSDEYCRILGLPMMATPTRARFVSMVHEDDVQAVSDCWLDAIENGTAFDIMFRIIREDGVVRHVRVRSTSERGEDGRVSRMHGTMLDDTDRIEAERIRRAAETRFEAIFEQSEIGAVIVDLDGNPTRVNTAMCLILCRSRGELLGRRWEAYTHPDEIPLGKAVLARVAEGFDTYSDERRYIRPMDGPCGSRATSLWSATTRQRRSTSPRRCRTSPPARNSKQNWRTVPPTTRSRDALIASLSSLASRKGWPRGYESAANSL